ncbi:MAG: glutaredoxin family protein [Methylococcaceae bacterium]
MSLLLFGTQGCHLCEQAQTLLSQLAIPVEKIDIANEIQWQTEFAVLIPVLYHSPSQRYINWPFDSKVILSFIQSLSET